MLGIAPLSSFEDINKKYKKLVKQTHPDLNDNNDKITEINRAYEILREYIRNYKFTFSEDEILKQYPSEFLKKFKV
ncbi:dnajb11 protein [Nautilia profundicola AmH]|uniref:Dnajb11 protein n=1 Tax=Nautilia profundicola (strain ATCC BAA-1463 / DSM 18972 / AmH) TaxID=598659 RepID=B9L9F1_NAUPA|nr:J domain-containing protein [Nautilia profundicola]ACM92123.1 dnajb11 protein [Nautilia profundicola AmH]